PCDGLLRSAVKYILQARPDASTTDECSNLNSIAEKHGNDKVIIGGIDIGKLTYGTTNDVINEVKRCLKTAGSCPGYFINVSGSIPDNVPIMNLETYFKAVKKYGLKPRMKTFVR
ncbi:hypothetical protein KEJ17_02325, partial [Candidatus Bathyarchaeota archaeon]|nr:hypothetical protein [Candidatus Bathyarchaeota archaeon]